MKTKTRIVTVEIDEELYDKLMYNKKRNGVTIHHQINSAITAQLKIKKTVPVLFKTGDTDKSVK